MPEVAISLGALLAEATRQLRDAGVPEPRRQALYLWTELNGVGPAAAILSPEVALTPASVARYNAAIERRSAGEPLAYVTGQWGFRHLTLKSDRRALIPRPETEGLVELLLQRVRTGVAADVGTGTGCIALSLAMEGEFERILAIDVSPDALALARLNHALLASSASVHFARADLLTGVAPGSLDALISNPPYLTLVEYERLDPAVRDWEPAEALRAGPDGMEATGRLIQQGRGVLRPGGWLALEVDCTRAPVAARLAQDLGWQDVSVHVDLFGRERYLLARRSNTR
jgi:release factor glutamine methyltransferase